MRGVQAQEKMCSFGLTQRLDKKLFFFPWPRPSRPHIPTSLTSPRPSHVSRPSRPHVPTSRSTEPAILDQPACHHGSSCEVCHHKGKKERRRSVKKKSLKQKSLTTRSLPSKGQRTGRKRFERKTCSQNRRPRQAATRALRKAEDKQARSNGGRHYLSGWLRAPHVRPSGPPLAKDGDVSWLAPIAEAMSFIDNLLATNSDGTVIYCVVFPADAIPSEWWESLRTVW